jgi:hypothetical protein
MIFATLTRHRLCGAHIDLPGAFYLSIPAEPWTGDLFTREVYPLGEECKGNTGLACRTASWRTTEDRRSRILGVGENCK